MVMGIRGYTHGVKFKAMPAAKIPIRVQIMAQPYRAPGASGLSTVPVNPAGFDSTGRFLSFHSG
jgi:hypothetical protein